MQSINYGRFWKILHRLVYPVMFALVLHTAMQGKDFQLFGLDFGIDYTLSYAIPSFIILILQIASHIYHRVKKYSGESGDLKVKNKLYPVIVKSIKANTDNAKTIALQIPQEHLIDFEFISGQHISISVDLKGKNYRRSYSITDPKLEGDTITIGVKKVKDGTVSKYLNEELKSGQTIEISAPYGKFFRPAHIADTKSEIVFWAGGSGITPILGVIRYLLLSGHTQTIKLIYANSNSKSVMFGTELEDLTKKYSNLNIVNIISNEPLPNSKNSNIAYKHSRLNESLVAELAPDKDSIHYICGPDALMEICQQALVKIIDNKDNIHLEWFGKKPTAKDVQKMYRSGDIAPENGDYMCVDCGHILSLKAGEIFGICEICLAGETDTEYEFWLKV